MSDKLGSEDLILGTHLVVMNTWGVINSFGVFQSHYAQTLPRPPSDNSWIGSIQIFLLFFIGTFTGRLTDAGLFRPVALVGSILVVLGSIATSFSTQYWQIFLFQGVYVGLGNGCLFCPTIALVSTYFQKRRSLAIGFTACGSTTGGVLYPAIVRQLLPLLSLRPRLPPRTTGQLVEWGAFKELECTFYGIGMFLCFWGSYFVFFFTAAYGRDIRGMSYTSSLDVLMIMSGVGIVGRILPSYLADHIGALTVLVPTAGAGGLIMFTWLAADTKSAFYAWAAISGIILGGIQAVFPSALASLTADPSKQDTRIGMMFTIQADIMQLHAPTPLVRTTPSTSPLDQSVLNLQIQYCIRKITDPEARHFLGWKLEEMFTGIQTTRSAGLVTTSRTAQ
ncbi:Aspyridones efflux protein apdF [Colletotrichum aenigma]|uniref:Aspyridones efflux protein apdF n=1 Tax=Colletotrichum aenigma TaxID=1215731 RepID=UPI001872E2A8|nr:Aspyridones efflux protein apdF [Colletotrichum aenigma]KAF5520562.1 Aspyridones efflux protein apdF [Colletotrichum aenigma]